MITALWSKAMRGRHEIENGLIKIQFYLGPYGNGVADGGVPIRKTRVKSNELWGMIVARVAGNATLQLVTADNAMHLSSCMCPLTVPHLRRWC